MKANRTAPKNELGFERMDRNRAERNLLEIWEKDTERLKEQSRQAQQNNQQPEIVPETRTPYANQGITQ